MHFGGIHPETAASNMPVLEKGFVKTIYVSVENPATLD